MLIDLSLHCGATSSGIGEARVLIDAIERYRQEISRDGFASNEGDAPATLSALLSVSLRLMEGLLDQTETLDPVLVSTGKETDGLPDYLTAFYPADLSNTTDAFTRVLNQRAVLQTALDRTQPPRTTREEVNPNTETGTAPGADQ